MGSARGELGIEVSFHLEPLAVMANFAAPTAHTQEIFEVMETLEQPPRGQVNPNPDEHNDQSAKQGAAPVGSERFTENEMGNTGDFREPGKTDDQRKAKSFNPEDGIPALLGFVHRLTVRAWEKLVEQKPPLFVSQISTPSSFGVKLPTHDAHGKTSC